MPVLLAAAVVLIHSCTYWRVPSYPSHRGSTLHTLGVSINYENVSNALLTGVTFLIQTRDHIEYVTDRGSFAPSVDIDHQFYTSYFPYYEAKTSPDACRVARVRFANGTWQNVQ
jgi:hypothetical protein